MAGRGRRVVVGSVVFVALLAGAVLVLPPLLWGDRADYSHVVSIEKTASYKDEARMTRAWQLPVAALYHHNGVDWQRNPSFCGPASLVNVLRSRGQEADQATVLEGSGKRTFLGFLMGGMTLDQLAEAARRRAPTAQVTVLRDLDVAGLRAELAAGANDPSRRYIANFSRGPIFGRGGGHHSPIGGYLAEDDLVLVLDVNPTFQPWLVSTARLWEAINTVDRSSQQKRGLVRIVEPAR